MSQSSGPQPQFYQDSHRRLSLDSRASVDTLDGTSREISHLKGIGGQQLASSLNSSCAYNCVSCNQGFLTKSQYMSHLFDAHNVPHFNCDFCGRRFRMRQQMETHRRTHTGEKPYKCGKCAAAYTNAAALNYHKVKIHPEKKD